MGGPGRWAWAQYEAAMADVRAGNVRRIARFHLPIVFCTGAALGCVLSLLSNVVGVVMVLIAGAGLGYAARSYVSFRRRQRVRERLAP